MANVGWIISLSAGAALGCAWRLGVVRWRRETRDLRERLESAREPVVPNVVDFRELEGLPPVVQRFLRAALREGRPLVTGVRLRHRGTMDMGEDSQRWRPFTSNQRVVTRRPGFDWDGRMSMLPGLTARAHDAYVAGRGLLHASLFGLVTLAKLEDDEEMARGELMRFLAEAAWYPTALLPSQGVTWEAIDEHSARATLKDGPHSVSVVFAFGDDGSIESVSAPARGRMQNGQLVPTPWQGRFWSVTERGGMRVPLDGEVAWLPTTGAKPYWRGHVTAIEYEFAVDA